MTFDQTVLLWCAAVPALIALVAASVAWLVERTVRRRGWAVAVGALIAGGGWWAAIVIALSVRQSWQWWPEDAWRQAIWPILAAVLLLSSTIAEATATRPWRWVLAGLLASATAWVAMPSSPGWSDTFELHRTWMFLVSISCLVNAWALDRLARSDAQRWALWVMLAGFAGPMALAASAYSGLAEWTLAAIAATVVFALINSFAAKESLGAIAFPAAIFLGAITAAGRFYSYQEHSAWLYAGILLLPAVVAAVDCPLHRQPAWRRVVVAALVAAILAGLIVWTLLFRGE